MTDFLLKFLPFLILEVKKGTLLGQASSILSVLYRLVHIRWNPIVWPFEGNLFYITTRPWQYKSLWLGRLKCICM